MNTRYLMEMTSMSDQKIRDSTPRMFTGVVAMPCSGRNAKRTA
jgi:hypothetical protein